MFCVPQTILLTMSDRRIVDKVSAFAAADDSEKDREPKAQGSVADSSQPATDRRISEKVSALVPGPAQKKKSTDVPQVADATSKPSKIAIDSDTRNAGRRPGAVAVGGVQAREDDSTRIVKTTKNRRLLLRSPLPLQHR